MRVSESLPTFSGGSQPSVSTPIPGLRTAAGRGGAAAAVSGQSSSVILTTRVGLRFPENLTYDSWEHAGHQISRVVNSSTWCLGDWLVYGQERYADRYRQAVAAAGLDYQTLRNYAWVARRFELSRRHLGLSLQHHAEVASLPDDEQDRWLEQAATLGWSRNQLRRAVRDHRHGETSIEQRKAVLPRVKVPRQTVERWQRAAEQAHVDLHRWVVETLDRAADLGDARS
jgi:hypothetical protein